MPLEAVFENMSAPPGPTRRLPVQKLRLEAQRPSHTERPGMCFTHQVERSLAFKESHTKCQVAKSLLEQTRARPLEALSPLGLALAYKHLNKH